MNYRLLDRGETMQEADEVLADAKAETWEPIEHWRIGMPYRGRTSSRVTSRHLSYSVALGAPQDLEIILF